MLVIAATTQLGVWLIRDVHGVSDTISDLTRSALIFLSAYPLIDVIVSLASNARSSTDLSVFTGILLG